MPTAICRTGQFPQADGGASVQRVFGPRDVIYSVAAFRFGFTRRLPTDTHVEEAQRNGPAPALMRLLSSHGAIGLSVADQHLYRRFRSIEPGLVSCIDDTQPRDARMDILSVELFGAAVGVCSIVVRTNQHMPPGRDRYGRIDLVIIDRHARGLGLGRLLTLAGVVQMLADHGEQLYSISCLAAHKAIAHILEGVGFHPDGDRADSYCHEQLAMDDPSHLFSLRARMLDAVAAAAQACTFRVRQQRAKLQHCGTPLR